MQSTEKVKKWKFDLWKFWFVINKYFIKNFFSLHSGFLFSLLFSQSTVLYIVYTSLKYV